MHKSWSWRTRLKVVPVTPSVCSIKLKRVDVVLNKTCAALENNWFAGGGPRGTLSNQWHKGPPDYVACVAQTHYRTTRRGHDFQNSLLRIVYSIDQL